MQTDTKDATRHDEGKTDYTHMHPTLLRSLYDRYDPGSSNLQNFELMLGWYYYREELSKDLYSRMLAGLMHNAAPVLDFGASKYAKYNYCGGMLYSRVMKSYLRHKIALLEGTSTDAESGLQHIQHAACNMLFAMTYELTLTDEQKERFDDRPTRFVR